MTAGVALGSNLGDRLGALLAAREEIAKIPGVDSPITGSPVYETEPVDCEPGAGGFLNAVIEFSYNGELQELFDELRRIEVALGRPAEHQRNVSRRIDIDLLYLGDTVLASEALTLPHPRISQRRFVLQPLADVAPDRILPGQTKTVRELLASAPHSGKVQPATSQWEDS
jgi:2-amino-4-hydroxy-6-hydroxymethyldihydropteridine diphosphokinase